MSQNIVEKLREESVRNLFNTKGMIAAWPTWKAKIDSLIPNRSANQIFDLGDRLKEIFYTTNMSKVRTDGTRSQSEVSGGGANWEALVCWYLNLCCIGRRSVVIKHNKNLMPDPISNAIIVNYGTFVSNTESDLIAITFPDKPEYSMDKKKILINDEDGNQVKIKQSGKMNYNLKEVLNALVARDFTEIEIHIIQCKTNWNDNAQIPMLWDMIYSADNFKTNITIGREGYSISNARLFTYAFATVPTVRIDKFKSNSVAVLRVSNLSGGNYWGIKSISGVASSMKEMLSRNLSGGANCNHKTTLKSEIPKLSSVYDYFKI
ncbi:MAG: hypothetical protein NC412_07080 [Roseburia sp.]|nr:hypothetical protein [Roseburia sp.]MCM1279785.1 hypothetical protein [Robinsoniella sp.]